MSTAPRSEPVHLVAPGLVLRAYHPTDLPDLHDAFVDEDIAQWNPGPTTEDEITAFMTSRNDWSGAEHASWALADDSDRLIGAVSLHRIDADQADAEIGYWIAPWARRRGNAVTAVLTAARFGFGGLGLHRIYLYHALENPGSCAVAQAAGFALEGTLRESYRYADGRYHDEHLHGLLSRDLPREDDRG